MLENCQHKILQFYLPALGNDFVEKIKQRRILKFVFLFASNKDNKINNPKRFSHICKLSANAYTAHTTASGKAKRAVIKPGSASGTNTYLVLVC